MVQRAAAVNLVFDMHGEYGWQGTDEGRPGGVTKGLRQLYPDRVQVFTLDPRPFSRADWAIKIPYSYLEPSDVLSLQKVLALNPTAAENSYLLERRLGGSWFAQALQMDAREVATEEQAHEGAMAALRRKLARLAHECDGFLVRTARRSPAGSRTPWQRISSNLERGIHTVIDFGRYNKLSHYILVANLLTRRIDEKWRTRQRPTSATPSAMPGRRG